MSRDLLLLAISLFAWGLGEGMFIYFQSLYLQKWGANPLEIGAILGSMGIAMAIAQAPAGYLADRVGSRPVMWASWVLGTIAAAVMALSGSLGMFVAGLLIYGLTSFVVAPMNSYITSVRGNWSVQRALTTVSAMFHLGAVAGPIIGGLIGEAVGLQNVYRVAAVTFLVSTGIVLFARRPPVEVQVESTTASPNLFRNPRFIGLLALIVLTMFGLYLPQPLTPNYLQNQHGFSLQIIGQLGAVGSLSNAVIMLGLGGLSAPTGFLVGQMLVGLFAFLMWRGEGLGLFYAGYLFIGGYRLSRSMALAYARSLVKPSETGFAYGLMETGNAIAVILAPPVAGFLYNYNPRFVYAAALAAICLMVLINAFLLPGKRLFGPQPDPNPTPVEQPET
jgi:MFS family permease